MTFKQIAHIAGISKLGHLVTESDREFFLDLAKIQKQLFKEKQGVMHFINIMNQKYSEFYTWYDTKTKNVIIEGLKGSTKVLIQSSIYKG